MKIVCCFLLLLFLNCTPYSGFRLTDWEPVYSHENRKAVIQIEKNQLLLGLDTLHSSDSMQSIGVRSQKAFFFSKKKTIDFTLDWNEQTNGSYLEGGFFLSAEKESNLPESSGWFGIICRGVPPGKLISLTVKEKQRNQLVFLKESGAFEQKTLQFQWIIGDNQLDICVNGSPFFSTSLSNRFSRPQYLYFILRSGTNFSLRTILYKKLSLSS